jgi:hypothetical protein
MDASGWTTRLLGVLTTTAVLVAPRPAAGQILVDHPPYNSGGPASDTLLIDEITGATVFQQVADNFSLTADSVAGAASWHGFYGGFDQNHQPPAGDETMRVRLYQSRASDGLPGNVLYEEAFLNATRTWTGRIVEGQFNEREYRFDANLSQPVPLQAGVRYWFEAVQVGNITSTFRLEYSLTDLNHYALLFTGVPDWISSNSTSDLSFRLYAVPEPMTLFMLMLGASVSPIRSRSTHRHVLNQEQRDSMSGRSQRRVKAP